MFHAGVVIVASVAYRTIIAIEMKQKRAQHRLSPDGNSSYAALRWRVPHR